MLLQFRCRITKKERVELKIRLLFGHGLQIKPLGEPFIGVITGNDSIPVRLNEMERIERRESVVFDVCRR